MSIRAGGIVTSNACGTGNKLFQFCTMLAFADKHNLHLRGGVNKKFNKFIIFDPVKIGNIRKLDTNLSVSRISSAFYDKETDELTYSGDFNYETTDFFQHAPYLNNNYE